MVLDDVEAHNHAMSVPITQAVRELVDILGPTLVAAIGGVQETRAVQQWMVDREPQRPQVLRFALQLAKMISTVADGSVARSWFQGSNPRLRDKSPVMVLRQLPLDDAQPLLMQAARAFSTRSDHSADHTEQNQDRTG
jgi:hypothetical protein